MALNCLIKNTQIVEDITQYLVGLAKQKLANNNDIGFTSLYKDFRKQGVEIDMESFGSIYNGVFSQLQGSNLITPIQEVESVVGKELREHQKQLADATLGNFDNTTDQIGNLSPEKANVKALAAIFQQDKYPSTATKTKSIMKAFQDILLNGLKSNVERTKKEKTPTSALDALDDFFRLESTEIPTIDGLTNKLSDLEAKTKVELDKYLDGLTENMDEVEANILREEWNNYFEQVIASTYDIMLSSQNQNKVLDELLKNIQINGESIVDPNGDVSWSKISKANNPDLVRLEIKKALIEGVTDKLDNTRKYTEEQAERISQYVMRAYENKLAAYRQRVLANQPNSVISSFIKEKGFFGLTSKNGVPLATTKSDWKNFLKELKEKGKKSNDIAKEAGILFRKYITDNNIYKDPKKIDQVVNTFEQKIISKLLPSSATPNAFAKLGALSTINNGISFKESTQQAVTSLVGVNNLTASTLQRIHALADAIQAIQASTGDNELDARYALTALAKIDREIRMLVHENKDNSAGLVFALREVSDMIQSATVTLLINPMNATENITTAVAQNIFGALETLMTSPKLLFKTISLKTFWTSWINHVAGSASTINTIAEDDFSGGLEMGERYTLQNFLRDFKGKRTMAGKIGSILVLAERSPSTLAMLFNRVIMNSFDVAFNVTLAKRQMMMSTYTALKENNYSSNEALALIDKANNLDTDLTKKISNTILQIDKNLKLAGLGLTELEKKQIAIELRAANYSLLIKQDQKTRKNLTDKQVDEGLLAMLKGAKEATKVMTGKKNMEHAGLISFLIRRFSTGSLFVQKKFFELGKKYEERGDVKTGMVLEVFSNILFKNGIAKFVGGRANFANLGMASVPIIGIGHAISARLHASNYKKDNVGVEQFDTAENLDKLAKYYEKKAVANQLVARQSMSLLLGALLGGIFFANNDDDEEKDNELKFLDEYLYNLSQTKSGQRFISKQFPTWIAAMAVVRYESVTEDDKYNTKLDRFIKLGMDAMAETGESSQKAYFIKKEIDEGNRDKALGMFLNGLWNANVKQIEQVTQSYDVVQSAISGDFTQVEDNERVVKELYKQQETMWDAYGGLGAYNTIERYIKNKDVNQFRN